MNFNIFRKQRALARPVSVSSPLRRRLLQILGTTAAAWGLQLQALAQSGAPAPAVLRIGYQKSAANLVIVKQSGWLEQRLPGTKVSWVEFPAGPQLLEALAVGSLEFGLTGDSPRCSRRRPARTCCTWAPSRPSRTARPSWCSRTRR
jgi:ABC-type nitrate/sulfonate/bicarbonate transport system substrate-binding protein